MSPIISLKPYLQWLRDSEIIWDRKSRKEKQKLVPRQHQGHDAEAQNQRWVQSTSNKFTAQTSAWYERNLWYVINWQIPSILYIYQAALLSFIISHPSQTWNDDGKEVITDANRYAKAQPNWWAPPPVGRGTLSVYCFIWQGRYLEMSAFVCFLFCVYVFFFFSFFRFFCFFGSREKVACNNKWQWRRTKSRCMICWRSWDMQSWLVKMSITEIQEIWREWWMENLNDCENGILIYVRPKNTRN